jgi:hypothetical protein
MGMKRSPVLNAENQVSRQAVERLCEYLVDQEQKPALVFIRNIIQEELLRKTS